jgi:hypothetical protein
MAKPQLAENPKHPERICWGCDKYCSSDDLRCGNGTIRTQHPVELFGEDWLQWELHGDSSSRPTMLDGAGTVLEHRVPLPCLS